MNLRDLKNPTGICKGCGKPTDSRNHSDCHLFFEDKHSTSKKRQKKLTQEKAQRNYKSGNLPKWMFS